MKLSPVTVVPLDALARPRAQSLSLLEPEPVPRSDDAALCEALVFAFATGDAGQALERAVDETPFPPSPWQGSDFAADVFLAELIERCLCAPTSGRASLSRPTLLLRVLSSPPASVMTARFRQDVFAELLARGDLETSLETLRGLLAALRGLLAKPAGLRIDALERRLAVLRAVRDVVELAATAFKGATSALSRVHAWGEETRAQPGYQRLVELVAYEECTAEVDVRLRLGIDGSGLVYASGPDAAASNPASANRKCWNQ